MRVKYREIVRLIEADGWRGGRRRISFVKPDQEDLTDERISSRVRARGRELGRYCPDLPGLGVVGDSREEVEQLIREAIPFHLDGLREAGDPIPAPAAVATTLVDVSAA